MISNHMTHPVPSATGQLLGYRHKRAIAVSLCLAAAFYLTIVVSSGYMNVLAAIQRIDLTIWLLLLACSFCSYLLRYSRWQYFLRRHGYQLPHRLHFIYYLAGFALTTTPGKTGEVIRSVLLRPHGIPYSQSIATFFTERFMDVIVITIMSSQAILAFADYAALVIVVAILLLLFVSTIRQRRLHARLRHWQRRLSTGRFRQALWHLLAMLRRARDLLAPVPLYLGLAIGGLAWGVQGLAFGILVGAMDVSVDMPIALGIYATGLFIGAISFIPGGIGTTEATMYLLLKSVGADEISAITIPLVSRLSTLWFAMCLGLVATSYLSLARHTTQPSPR